MVRGDVMGGGGGLATADEGGDRWAEESATWRGGVD